MSNAPNQQQSANIQSELLARSGFQPYRPDERHIHPAGAQYPMDAFSPFGPIPGMPSELKHYSRYRQFLYILIIILGGLFNSAALPYPESLYLDQSMLMHSMMRSNPHAALYSQLASPYASHLYRGPPNLSGLHERMKLEEEHRARIAREEEKVRIAREEEKARERERELREKEMREREQREKEMREREQREKEMREREMRELREKEMRERELREKEHREREMREKEMREREKMMQQHHFMQRNPYNLLGLFPQMVGLRPPSGMHPSYQMHPSLLGLAMPQIPTSLANMQHHVSQSSQSGSSSSPITSQSLMPPMGSLGLSHGLPPHMSLYPGNLPPPAHLYSPLAPPSASPSNLSNSYNHPMMNPATSPQPVARSPSSSQSLNLSKNHISSSQYANKERTERVSSTTTPTVSVATVSVSSDRSFKIEIPNISNGNKDSSAKNEDLSAAKVDKSKDEKVSPDDDMKPIAVDKLGSDMKISDNESINPEEKVKVEKKDESSRDLSEPKEIKTETDEKSLNPNDNKAFETEKIAANLETKAEVKDEDMKVDDEPSINDKAAVDASTITNDNSKTPVKK